MTRRVEVAIELAKKEKVVFDEKMKDKSYREEIEQKRLRILEADKAKKAQVGELMTKSKDAEANGNYTEAEQFAKMAAEIDPNNIAATAQATKIRWMRRYERDKDIRDQLDETAVTAMQEVSAAGIVPEGVQTRGIAYPTTFADLTRSRRDLAERLAIHKDPKTLEVEAKLNEYITLEITDEQPLGSVMDYLASYTGLNIVVDPRALAEEGLTPNSPVKLKVKDITLKTALKLMLSPLNLTYKTEPGVLLITSPQADRSQTYAQAYPVGDLVISPHGRGQQSQPQAGPAGSGITPANPSLGSGDPNVNLTGMGGTANGEGFAVGSNAASPNFVNAPQVTYGTRNLSREDFEPLIQLIRTSVAPGTWQSGPDQGYNPGGYGYGGGRRWSRARGRAAYRFDHAVLPEHQPDHSPHVRGSRRDRRPASAASPSAGPPDLRRGAVHHGQRQLLRADRRRLRLRHPVRHRRPEELVRDPEPGGSPR